MNKAQRLAAAQEALDNIEEGNSSLICENIAREFDLRESEVEKMYWGPAKMAYTEAQRAAR